jgi:hypothetical protein
MLPRIAPPVHAVSKIRAPLERILALLPASTIIVTGCPVAGSLSARVFTVRAVVRGASASMFRVRAIVRGIFSAHLRRASDRAHRVSGHGHRASIHPQRVSDHPHHASRRTQRVGDGRFRAPENMRCRILGLAGSLSVRAGRLCIDSPRWRAFSDRTPTLRTFQANAQDFCRLPDRPCGPRHPTAHSPRVGDPAQEIPYGQEANSSVGNAAARARFRCCSY